MTKRSPKKWQRRRETYLTVGILAGISLMIIPALVHTLMGPTSPFGFSTAVPTFTEATAIISPLDLVYELILLAIPAIFIVIVIYWIAGRRSSWAGYNEAVKWTRR